VERAHYIGGFGRIRTLAANVLEGPPASPDLAANEAALIEDLNRHLASELQMVGRMVPRQHDGPWHISGLDTEGVDLANGLQALRVDFARPAATVDDVRELLADQLRMRAAQQ
jgi:hypothetical protein